MRFREDCNKVVIELRVVQFVMVIGLSRIIYIEVTISFLIGRKRTVNFRNQRL